jgi:hypothetical protein
MQPKVQRRIIGRRFKMADVIQLQKMLTEPDYRHRYHLAKATKTCILCSERAVVFRSASSQLEYRISALCQECQDRLFEGVAVFP